jgi:protein-arginine deiminase
MKRILFMVSCFLVALIGSIVLAMLGSSFSSSFGASRSLGTDEVVFVADTNRDGQISRDDLAERDRWSWAAGALMVANVDDDDADGIIDAEDNQVNGDLDVQDLAIAKLQLPRSMQRDSIQSYLQLDADSRDYVHLFQLTEDGWKPLVPDPDQNFLARLKPNGAIDDDRLLTIGIEATQFANKNWSGQAQLTVMVQTEQGEQKATDTVRLRVSPWMMIPNTAKVTDLYIGYGYYENDEMLSQLEAQLPDLGVTLHEYETDVWQEMWMQDTMEIGYQQLPGHPPMSVVLRANRGHDSFPKTLLAPDMGYITVGRPRRLRTADELVDWLGNLEVSVPLPDFPLGRIYYGKDTKTGVGLHPEVVDFLERQELQSPVPIDTSWLFVKHADEVLNFFATADGTPYVLVNNMHDGINALKVMENKGAGDKDVGFPPLSVTESLQDYTDVSQRLQATKLDPIVDGVKRDFQLSDRQIIRLPGMVTGTEEAATLWSNSVNSTHVNGTLFIGDPFDPQVQGQNILKQELFERLKPLGVRVSFLDDRPYQEKRGNVHCATNTRRLPLYSAFWEHLPSTMTTPDPA